MEVTEKQLSDLLTKAIASAVRTAIEESRKPTPEELAKKLKEEEDANRRMQEMLTVARAEEEAKKQAWANCKHVKEDGRPSVSGQVHSDGKIHPICLRCQFEFTPYAPTSDMLANGIQ